MKPTVQKNASARRPGRGQLTLVEHALCPLDPQASLVENQVHDASYYFMDGKRSWRRAQARVICPLGLSASDELYLWGLLALTFAQEESDGELHATPHFCLTRLGLIDAQCRGGRHYHLFAKSMERLASVHYQNDSFYDPVRGEHRKVGFGFFSYSLPLDPQSSRAWRIAWDPIFFEFARATSGHLRFDLLIYRDLDSASRRLFLLLSKIFHRRSVSPSFELRHLAVSVLGFSPTLETRDLKRKMLRCIHRLQEFGIVAGERGDVSFRKKGPGQYVFAVWRGKHFENRTVLQIDGKLSDSPLREPLRTIGFDDNAVAVLLLRYPGSLLREWTDITLAAMERMGPRFFKKSPAAYFVDNVKQAARGTRTSPDWWLQLRKAEFEFAGRRKVVRLMPSKMKGKLEPVREIVSSFLIGLGKSAVGRPDLAGDPTSSDEPE